MPIYNYECVDCGYEFDQKLPFSASGSLVNCPKCGKEARKGFTIPFIIWGKGFFRWYNDGKQNDTIVSTPTKTRRAKHNELHADGGL